MSSKFTLRVSVACLLGAACGSVTESAKPDADMPEPPPPPPPAGALLQARELFPSATTPAVDATFTTSGGYLLVLASGSGWSANGAAALGMKLTLDETELGEMGVYTNEPSSHKSFVTRSFGATPAAGSHKLTINATAATSATGGQDSIRATLLELGAGVTERIPFASHIPTAEQLSVPFKSGGGTLLFLVAGSGYATTAGAIGMSISLGTQQIGATGVITNEVSSHKSFVTSAIVTRPPAGDHVLEIRRNDTTFWDDVDRVNVGALEFDSTVTATPVLENRAGPAPWMGQVTSRGGTLVILVSASGFRSDPNEQRPLGLVAKVSDRSLGTVSMVSNEVTSHKALPANFLVVNDLPAGTHTITLEAAAGTATDATDFTNVTVLEFPRP